MPYVYSVITVITLTYNTTVVPRFEYAIDKEGTQIIETPLFWEKSNVMTSVCPALETYPTLPNIVIFIIKQATYIYAYLYICTYDTNIYNNNTFIFSSLL